MTEIAEHASELRVADGVSFLPFANPARYG
jgi:hypothetical protein